jgi:carboxypeptidase C (cathepsin A)
MNPVLLTKLVALLSVVACGLQAQPAPAAATPPAAAGPAADTKPPAPPKRDQPLAREVSETEHTVVIGGKSIHYVARAGVIALRNAKGEETADVFFIAYTLKDAAPESRPLTFSFNGGPGSSSVWLHLGVLGPRRVLLHEEGWALPPPHVLVDNEFSLLDVSDLVFIDPVSTGFSRAREPDKAKEFHGLTPDIEAVGDFIRQYVSE